MPTNVNGKGLCPVEPKFRKDFKYIYEDLIMNIEELENAILDLFNDDTIHNTDRLRQLKALFRRHSDRLWEEWLEWLDIICRNKLRGKAIEEVREAIKEAQHLETLNAIQVAYFWMMMDILYHDKSMNFAQAVQDEMDAGFGIMTP